MSVPWSRRLLSLSLLLFEPEWRALTGRAAPGRVFWVYGVLVSAGLALLFLLAREAGRADLQQLLLLLFPGYTAAILVALRRARDRALGRRGARAHRGLDAQHPAVPAASSN